MRRRKTKIICTIGPSCDKEEIITRMIREGMNIARINCSHGDQKSNAKIIEMIKKVRVALNAPVAIMIDTRGPEFRLGEIEKNTVLKEGQNFKLLAKKCIGNSKRASIDCSVVLSKLNNGDIILINDGLMKLEVVSAKEDEVECKVVIGGKLKSHKSLNFPNKKLDLPYLSDADKKDLLYAVEHDVDFVACSFISTKENIQSVRDFLDVNGGESIQLLSKIENQTGIDNLAGICANSDGIMVARGDLGVEVNFNQLPSIQKYIINYCRQHATPVVVCTEMLETMSYNLRPTRAEISDVANAIYDGASAIMLSAETASGDHPIESVQVMHNIAVESENSPAYNTCKIELLPQTNNKNIDALAHSACTLAKDIDSNTIICFTEGGYTANFISHIRPDQDVVAVTNDKKVYYQLSLKWGTHPLYQSFDDDIYDIMHDTKKFAKEWLKLQKGDIVVEIVGWANIAHGSKNMVQILNI